MSAPNPSLFSSARNHRPHLSDQRGPATVPVSAPELPDDAAAARFATDETYFFGLRRRAPEPLTPAPHEVAEFIYDPVNADRFKALADGENLLIIGPPGCGKTLSSKWFAHEWGVNFYLMSHNAHTQADDILGASQQDPDTGIWHYVPSNLVRAYRDGGVVSADEILALKPGPLQVYHPFLNGDAVIVASPRGPEKIVRHPRFRWVGTANHWAKTRGNNEIGEALLDRAVAFEMDYIAEDLEAEAIRRVAPEAPAGLVGDLVTFAAAVRSGVKTNPERNHYLPTTRMLARLARHIGRGRADVVQACETMIFAPVLVRYPEEIDAIRAVFGSIVAL